MTAIKTGICSYGMSGKLFHAPFIAAHPGFELTAIVERTKDEARSRYPNVKIYRSIDQLLADETITLIIVNTPVQTHYEFAKAAIEAGKHVVLEKPMVVTAREGEELVQLARDYNVILSVYQNRRYDGDYRAVRDILQAGLLGDIKEVEIKYDRYRAGFSGKNHKEGYLPGSGVLYDLGSHLIDQSLQLFGLPKAIFADVWAMKDAGKADDYFELLLYYPGFRVRLKASTLVREAVPAFILHGTKGSFLQQRSDLQEQELLAGVAPSVNAWCTIPSTPDGLLHTEIDGKVVRKEMHSVPGNYMDYYTDLLLALTNKASNPVPGEDGIKIVRIIESALQSVNEERLINIQ